MVVNAASAEGERRSPSDETAEVSSGSGIGEEQLSVKYLGELFVEIDANELSACGEGVRTMNPADVLDKVEVVLCLELVRARCRAELKAGRQEREFVNAAGQIVRRTIDAYITG